MTKVVPHAENLGKNTPTKKRLLGKIDRYCPGLNEKETADLLIGIKKFVKVVQRMRTEPQFLITYKDIEENGKIEKYRIIETDLEELAKVLDRPQDSILLAMRKLSKFVPKAKYGKRPKKI